MHPVTQSAFAIIEHPQSLRDDDWQSKTSSFGPHSVNMENYFVGSAFVVYVPFL